MIKRKRNLIIVGTILILGAIGWHFYSKMKGGAGEWGGMPPTAVNVEKVAAQNWQQQVQASGTLNAQQGVMLKAETAGRITKIFVDSSQTVNANDPLFEINPSILEAQLDSAKAQVELNIGNYNRALELFKRGALSQQDLDTALANKNAAQANADAINAQLTENIIRAPFAGTLGIRLFNLGDYITQGQSLINLQSLDPLRVDFTVPEQYAGQIHIGDKLTVQNDAYPNKAFNGTVSAIDSAIDINTRTLAVRAVIPNPKDLLLPGNFVNVNLFVGQPRSLSTIPQIAVIYDPDGNYVYKVVNNKAKKTLITIVDRNNTQVAVKSELKPGDTIIVSGQLKVMMDGAPVMVVPPAKVS